MKIAIIPARGGSVSIPDKNICLLNGKPLINYTIDAAKKSKIDKIYVSTDSEKISRIVKKENIEVIFRPKELATDTSSTLSVIQYCLKRISNCKIDFVMTLQPTSPLRTFNHINESIELFINNNEADSLVSIQKVPHNFVPESLMKIDHNGYLSNYKENSKKVYRRQEKNIYYARNGAAIYITRTEKLKNYIFGGKIIPYFMDAFSSVDIDSYDELKMAEIVLKNYNKIG